MRAVAEIVKNIPGIADSEPAKIFIAVMGPTIGLALGRGAFGLMANRVPKLTEGYAKAFDNDPEKVAEHATKHESDANFNDLLYRSFRLMMDAPDEDVVPTIGYLMGRYSIAGKKADGQFRRTGRLLCDIEGRELENLKTLLRDIVAKRDEIGDHGAHVVQELERTPTEEDAEVYTARVSVMSSEGGGTPLPHAFDDPKRLFGLLKRERFAAESPPLNPGSYDEQAPEPGDKTMWVFFSDLEELLADIDPQPAT